MSQPRLPGYGKVFVTQFMHLTKSWYAPTVVLMPLLGLWWTYRNLRIGQLEMPPWHLSPVMASAVYFVLMSALLSGIILWLGEPPSKRRYHWSLPVKRELHDLIRVAAGAVWLIIAFVAFLIVGYAVEPAITREQYLPFAGAYWLATLAVTLLVYFLACIATLLWDKALFWVALIVVGGTMIQERWVQDDAPFLVELRESLMAWDRPLTLGVALDGHERSSPWRDADHVKRVYNATQADYFARTFRGTDASIVERIRKAERAWLEYRFTRYQIQQPSWSPAITIWYVLVLCGMFLALRRRPNV